MENIFKGIQLEFSHNNTFSTAIEKATVANGKLFLHCLEELILNPPLIGKLTLNCGQRFFAKMGLNVSECQVEDGKTVLVCDTPPVEYDKIQRSYARIPIDISTEIAIVKPDAQNNLNTISTPTNGRIKDLNPAGALIEISKNDFSFQELINNLPVFTRLFFTLPHHPKELQIIGKVVKIKKSFNNFQLGVQFILKTLEDFQIMDLFYHEHKKQKRADEKGKDILEKDMKQLYGKNNAGENIQSQGRK